MNRDLDSRGEPAVDVERYVVEFMAQYMIRVLHILRGSLERKDLMSSFCTNLDLLCTKILGLITKGLWQTPQENNAPPMLYLLPSRSLAVLKCELIPDAIRAKSDVQQRHKRESTLLTQQRPLRSSENERNGGGGVEAPLPTRF